LARPITDLYCALANFSNDLGSNQRWNPGRIEKVKNRLNFGNFACAMIGLLPMLWLCAVAAADEWDARDRFGWGKQELTLAGGYGIGFEAFGSKGTDAADVEFGALIPNWGIGISNDLGDSFYRGSFSLHIEPQLLWNHEPRNGDAYGGGILFRYNLMTHQRFVPFIEGGGGFMSVDFDLVNQRDGFNFLLQSGVGAHLFVTNRAALLAGWRFHHMSNANTRRPNTGINSNFFQFGITYYFD
jgi:hypothetical protein